MSPSHRLFTIAIRFTGWLGFSLSVDRATKPVPALRITLFRKSTSCTTDQGDDPPWLRGVTSSAGPTLFSSKLPSTRTRCAFVNSTKFLIVHWTPAKLGWPWRQVKGLKMWFPRISMSDGTRLRMAGSAPPEHDVLGGALEEAIRDLEWARTVVAQDRLRVVPRGVDLGDIGVDHRTGGAVQQHTAPARQAGVTVNVAAIEDQIVRCVCIGCPIAAEGHDGVEHLDARGGGELHPDDAVVVRAGFGLEGGAAIRGQDLRHEGANRGGHARAGGR